MIDLIYMLYILWGLMFFIFFEYKIITKQWFVIEGAPGFEWDFIIANFFNLLLSFFLSLIVVDSLNFLFKLSFVVWSYILLSMLGLVVFIYIKYRLFLIYKRYNK